MLLDGVVNFRDFGGPKTADGRQVRHGRLYRSGGWSRPTDKDRAVVSKLGLKLIFDLRGPSEKEIEPSLWPDEHQAKTLNLDVMNDFRSGGAAVWDSLRESPDRVGAFRGMVAIYRQMPTFFNEALPVIFDNLLQPGQLPALFHCTAGKDRTGFLSAVLLLALGVHPDEVMRHYLTAQEFGVRAGSMESLQRQMKIHLGYLLDADAMEPIMRVEPDYLGASLGSMVEQHGSFEGYFASVGLTPERRLQLQAALLD